MAEKRNENDPIAIREKAASAYHTASRGKAAAFSSLAPETKPRSFLTEVLFWCMGKKEVVVVFITQALFGDFTIVLVAAP